MIKLAKQQFLRDKAMPTVLVCNGTETADKSLWLQEGYRFGKYRFRDDANRLATHQNRIRQLECVEDNAIMDGVELEKVNFSTLYKRGRR